MIILKEFFYAKSIVIVGVSLDEKKIGHVIFRNLLDGGYKGKIYLVNKNGGFILKHEVFKKVSFIKERIELAVIAVPADQVISVVKDCATKRIRNVIIISVVFKEIGNTTLEKRLQKVLKQHKIACIGVNGLGVLNVHNNLDTLFLPRYRMKRPRPGNISFISQSGAVGSAMLDLIGHEGYGVAKFISYGNATNRDESDVLEFLGKDRDTKVICMYIEGVQNGKKFLSIAKNVARKKPVIVLKGGTTSAGHAATISHTGSLAGSAEVYHGAFKQAGVLEVSSLREMFNIAKVLEKNFKIKGKNVQIITDGGGFGILAADAAERAGLQLPSLSSDAIKSLQKVLPPTASIKNPLDVIGDADTARYRSVLEVCMNEKQIDMILAVMLYQVPRLGTDAVDMLIDFQKQNKKPIVVVSPGGEFTQSLKRSLESSGVPVFDFPEEAVIALKRLVEFRKHA